jgi:hypothetical protein
MKKLKLTTNQKIYVFLAFIALILILFLTLIAPLFTKKSSYDYNSEKLDTSKDYVYTSTENINAFDKKTKEEIPYLNVSGPSAEKINKQILKDYNTIKTGNYYTYDYRAYISNNYLSIVVTTTSVTSGDSGYELTKYYIYNYDLATKSILSNTKLLHDFGISEAQIKLYLKNKFINYYYAMINAGYITKKNCTYKQFLLNKGINNYLDDTSYSVEKGSLILYRPFAVTPTANDYLFFTSSSYFRYVAVKGE